MQLIDLQLQTHIPCLGHFGAYLVVCVRLQCCLLNLYYIGISKALLFLGQMLSSVGKVKIRPKGKRNPAILGNCGAIFLILRYRLWKMTFKLKSCIRIRWSFLSVVKWLVVLNKVKSRLKWKRSPAIKVSNCCEGQSYEKTELKNLADYTKWICYFTYQKEKRKKTWQTSLVKLCILLSFILRTYNTWKLERKDPSIKL